MNRLAGLRRPEAPIWTLADQALVSGSNFLLGVMLARLLGLQAFGIYVIAQTYLLYANTFQAALVVSPMMTAVPAETDEAQRRRLLQGFFAYMVGVLLLTGLGVQAMAAVLGHWVPALALSGLAWPLAAAMAAFQTQDWLRRSLYVRNANRAVFLADLLAYGTQLLGLVSLGLAGALSPARALWIMAACFGASSAAVILRTRLWPHWGAAVAVVRLHWRSSLDFLASWQLQWVASSGVILIGSGFIGTQAAGAIKAVQNLLGPINVLFQWMDNTLPVRSVIKLREGGERVLTSYLRSINLLGLLALGIFSCGLIIIDDWLIRKIYGPEFTVFAGLVVYQAIYYFFGYAYRVRAYRYRALGETQILAKSSFIWAIFSVGTAIAVVPSLREVGIMLALVLGEVAALIALHIPGRVAAAAGTNWLVLPVSGKRRLFVSCGQWKIVTGALRMYTPSRAKGKLLKFFAPAYLIVGDKFGLFRASNLPSILTETLPELRHAMQQTAAPYQLAVLAGPPSPENSILKITAGLLNSSGYPIAFARLGRGSASKHIQAEAEILTELSQTDISQQVPQVLATAPNRSTIAGNDIYWLIESVMAGSGAPLNMTTPHAAFLSKLVLPTAGFGWAKAQSALRAAFNTPAASNRSIRSTIEQLLNYPGSTLSDCIEHGDFAPWNIRMNGDAINVIDWETANKQGIAWMDAVHHLHQTLILVERKSIQYAIESLLGIFTEPIFQEYRKACPTSQQSQIRILQLYFLRLVISSPETAQNGPALIHSTKALELLSLR